MPSLVTDQKGERLAVTHSPRDLRTRCLKIGTAVYLVFVFDGSFFFQVNVSVESSIESHASEEVSEGDKLKVPTAALVEPYQGRPQLKGMRVRAKLAGAGSGETTKYTTSKYAISTYKTVYYSACNSMFGSLFLRGISCYTSCAGRV